MFCNKLEVTYIDESLQLCVCDEIPPNIDSKGSINTSAIPQTKPLWSLTPVALHLYSEDLAIIISTGQKFYQRDICWKIQVPVPVDYMTWTSPLHSFEIKVDIKRQQ